MEILAPFDEHTQMRLKLMDAGCEAIVLGEEAEQAADPESYAPDAPTVAFLEFAKCFGILMNRAIDAGWVNGVLKGEDSNA